jgi:hypothetical protein
MSYWHDTPPGEFDQIDAAVRDQLAAHGLAPLMLYLPEGSDDPRQAEMHDALVRFSGTAEDASKRNGLLVLLAVPLSGGSTAMLPVAAARVDEKG